MTSARLRLRPLTVEDIPALLTYRSDANVCRYLPFEPMTEEKLAARLATDLGRRSITAEGQGLTFGAETISDGRLIGDVVLFYQSERDAGGELGYVFHPDVAGQGFAYEACALILELAFDTWDLHRVIAQLDARNLASARLAERLGMRKEAHYRSSDMFKGQWRDRLVYALLADDWRTHHAP